MKILHISSSYWPAFEFGGPIQTVHLLNKFLVKKGADVTVYTTNADLKKNRDIPLEKEVNADGVKVFYFPYYGYVHWTFSPSLFLALLRNIKNFDVVHITGTWNFPTAAAAFWARFYKKPYIISPRGSLMKEPLEKKSSFKKKIYLSLIAEKDLKNAAAVHFTAEMEKEEYLKAGLPLGKAIMIPNGLDIDSIFGRPTSEGRRTSLKSSLKLSFRKKFDIADNAKIVLFLSRLNWKKGLDTLIPAFARALKHENIKTQEQKKDLVLVLAGPDENNYKKEIKKIIDDVNLRMSNILRMSDIPNIIFTGMLVGDDKIAAYRESDIFVLPSYSENFGQVVIEAMAVGLPVVITKGVGISKEVEAAGAGLVVEKGINQVSEAILKILNNPDLAKKMGENGRKLVETEFSSEKVAEEFMKEYNQLIRDEN